MYLLDSIAWGIKDEKTIGVQVGCGANEAKSQAPNSNLCQRQCNLKKREAIRRALGVRYEVIPRVLGLMI